MTLGSLRSRTRIALLLGLVAGLAVAVQAGGPTVFVRSLQPSWTAPGGGGVYSAYYGPDAYVAVSPGTTMVYDGREAGIIKAGLAEDPGGGYWDEGLFAFRLTLTIDQLAALPLTYDVVNQYGENPVWMTIEIDTGVLGDRNDNTTYQFVPPIETNVPVWHTVDAGAGLWQKWNDDMGDVTGNPLLPLNVVAATHTGLPVIRAYLRLGMGDSYHGTAGMGTVGWVDKLVLGGVSYDFVVGADACKKNGWTLLSRADGSLFKNQGDCVSYVNTGK